MALTGEQKALLERVMPLVKKIAKEVASQWKNASEADLASIGTLAAAEIVADHNPERCDFEGGLAAGDDDEVERVVRERRLSVLHQEIEALPDAERSFITAYYDEDSTLDEIAERLGTSKKTAWRMHDRLKAKLAEALAMRGLGPEAASTR